MDVDSIFKANGVIISVAHFLGASSYKWNSSTNRLEKNSRRSFMIKRNFVIAIMTFLKLVVISSVISQWKSISTDSFKDTVLIVGSLFSGLSLACDLHVAIKEEQIPSFVNSFSVFILHYEDMYGRKNAEKQIPPTTYLLVGLFVTLTTIGFLVGILPALVGIECNLFFPLLRGLVRVEPGLAIRFALTILHFTTCVSLTSSYFVHMVLTVPFFKFLTTFGHVVNKSAPRNFSTPEIHEPQNITIARAVQILLNQLEECALNSIYPVFVVFMVTVIIFSLAVQVSVDLPTLLFFISALVDIVLFVFLYSFVIWPAGDLVSINNYYWFGLDVSGAALLKAQLKKMKSGGRTRKEMDYLKKLKRSVRPLQVKIGAFSKLEKGTPQAVLDIIVFKTVDLLLLMK